MATWIGDSLSHLMQRGGAVMWPLLGLSVVSMTLIVERCWYWVRLNHPWRLARVVRMGRLLYSGDRERAKALAGADGTVYGRIVVALAQGENGRGMAEQVVQEYRGQLDRFMPTLSTIITAAPMLGILGTVLGIISSFEVLSDNADLVDPRSVGQGIAEALITTAFGLSVAIVVVFAYNAFRAQVDRTLTRVEGLVNSVDGGDESGGHRRVGEPGGG